MTNEQTTIQGGEALEALAASTNKQGILALSEKGITVDTPKNTIRSNYTLEFCGLPTRRLYSERQLETALIKTSKRSCSN